MMQIIELVLYGYNKKVRHLHFNLGKVNIITGKTKSGKSVVGDIIDYCLGSDSCNIADGIVRNNVSWYGLLLQLKNEQIFVARKNPENSQQSTTICYIEIGDNLTVPQNCNFSSNTNVDGIKEVLSRRIGILENLHTPSNGYTRLPLAANIRHSLYYCFQGQDEIAAKNFLFHHQYEDFIEQAIKDTIPYFLGVINEENLALENEKSILKRQLKLEKQKIEENNYILDRKSERAIELISEARTIGLIDQSQYIDYKDYNSIYSALQRVMNWVPNQLEPSNTLNNLTILQNKLIECQNDYNTIRNKIENARRFIGESTRYSNEAEHQKKRLESIGLFENLKFDSEKCPLCSNKLKHPLPSVEALKNSIYNLDKSISNVSQEIPKLKSFISKLENDCETKLEEINNLKSEIDGIYQQEEELNRLKDINTRRGIVIGKISLWLDSVQKMINCESNNLIIKQIEDRIRKIDEIIDDNSVEERKQFALSRIQEYMTKWAKELELEHCDNPYRLDLSKMTVIVDKPDRPVPLKQLGSGSNWVGIHLITYFALQYYFINTNRPVPTFLFLDQPSQVYFPSEIGERNIDLDEVNKIYQFIINRTNELEGKLQVIIVDHANIHKDYFQQNICEDWWSLEKNLVPNDWYNDN